MTMIADIKPRPNRALYIEVLRRMTPGQRLAKAMELSELSRSLTRAGLRERHPQASEDELHALYLERLDRCRSRTY
jgi:hypothetical protein